jgi:hypothetical protein
VAKLKAARDRKREANGKCEGRKSYAEAMPETVALAKELAGHGLSYRKIAAELAACSPATLSRAVPVLTWHDSGVAGSAVTMGCRRAFTTLARRLRSRTGGSVASPPIRLTGNVPYPVSAMMLPPILWG